MISKDSSDSTMHKRYQRAQSIVQGLMTTDLVKNDTIFPTWIVGTNCFWYEKTYLTDKDCPKSVAKEYRIVDAKSTINKVAFDHICFARALEEVTGKSINPSALPITDITIQLCPMMIHFKAFGKFWDYKACEQKCYAGEQALASLTVALSPDSKWVAFSRESNLWVRETSTGRERALTHDGHKDCAYALGSSAWGTSLPSLPGVWSPDSKRLLTVRRDKREVITLPHVSHVPLDGTIRPQLQQYKVAYPGDKHVETFEVLSFDIVTDTVCEANWRPSPAGYDGEMASFFRDLSWWGAESRYAYFIDRERGDQMLRLLEFDTDTGNIRILIEEASDTYINTAIDCINTPLYRHLPATNEMIWYSERSGWGHLYLYDLAAGELKHSITYGEWLVRDILYVDEKRRELLIQTSSRVVTRDPYYRDICRLDIDSGEIMTLVSGDEEYLVHYPEAAPVLMKRLEGTASAYTSGISPCGNYLVVTRTRADQVPVSLLIDRNGKSLMELEVADISALPMGWQWPEPVKLRAADNSTDIFGLVFRPSDFSINESYPVVNAINSAPWLSAVPKGSFNTSRGYADRHYFHAAALAELGFIVLVLDSRGSPLRGKEFQDTSYGWIPSAANTDDHAFAIKQLAERYSYIDIDRVGICGNAYQCGLQNFLERQDLYKVCVQMMLIDNRLVSSTMNGDKCEGLEGPNGDKSFPEQLVEHLSGKLLLMGSMNSYLTSMYPPACVFRVIDALHKANKNFDMLIMPNVDFGPDNYMYRRSWDFLVTHLKGVEPPTEFALGEVTWIGDVGKVLEDSTEIIS